MGAIADYGCRNVFGAGGAPAKTGSQQPDRKETPARTDRRWLLNIE